MSKGEGMGKMGKEKGLGKDENRIRNRKGGKGRLIRKG